MSDLLPTLGALTLGGSAAVLALALAGRSTRSRYGAKWRCWAWLLLCLRLAVPLPLLPQSEKEVQTPIQLPAPSNTVIYQYTPAPDPGQQSAAGQSGQDNASPDTSHFSVPPPSTQAGTQTQPVVPTPEAPGGFTLSLSQVLALIWLIGAVIMVLWTLGSHLRFLAYLRRWARPVSDAEAVRIYNQLGDELRLDRRPRLITCAGLRAPMLAGLFHPVLLLPEAGLAPDALRYSLLHELVHFRRRDIWLKTLALWVNAIHWFNPLIWYLVRLVERDTELACDEGALRRLPPEEHAAYGRTILDAVERLKFNSAHP